VNDIIKANKLVLKEISVKKGDKHKVLSKQKIERMLEEARRMK